MGEEWKDLKGRLLSRRKRQFVVAYSQPPTNYFRLLFIMNENEVKV